MLANTHHNQHDIEVCTLNSYSVLLLMVILPQAETKVNLSLQLKSSNLTSYVQYMYICIHCLIKFQVLCDTVSRQNQFLVCIHFLDSLSTAANLAKTATSYASVSSVAASPPPTNLGEVCIVREPVRTQILVITKIQAKRFCLRSVIAHVSIWWL
jgi:hypothetical protein